MTDKEYRQRLHDSHLCRYCKKQDAYTLAGRVLCAECTEKDRERQRERRAKDGGKKNRDRVKANRDKWREDGLCTYCGKREPQNGRRVCAICVNRQKKRNLERDIAKGMNWPRGENGYCWTCNKRKAIDGKRLCQECYDIATSNALKAGEKSREGHERKGRIIC